MGRRKKYISNEDRRKANLKKSKNFYWENKKYLDEKSKAYYWKKKIKKYLDEDKLDEAKLNYEKALKKGIKKEYLIIEGFNDNI